MCCKLGAFEQYFNNEKNINKLYPDIGYFVLSSSKR